MNPCQQQHWAKYTPVPTPQTPNPRAQMLPTLDSHLKQVIHPQYKLGMADTTTCYYTHWQKTLPHMMTAASNAFMARTDVTTREKRTAIQYRCGQLYNNKLGKRWGHTTSDKCPLCGDTDGGHHIASGCKELNKMHIARHHQAGRTILKALLTGERAAEVAYADVGSPDNLNKDGVPTLDPRHTFRLPKSSTRPDIVLVSTTSSTRHKINQITLVEIKYCRDSDISSQLDRAKTQHQSLQDRLKQQHQCPVQVLPILLGVSGAIYQLHTQEALQSLGVRGAPLKSTMRKLHTQAIQQLTAIVSTRRKLERSKNSHNSRGRGRPAGRSYYGAPRLPAARSGVT